MYKLLSHFATGPFGGGAETISGSTGVSGIGGGEPDLLPESEIITLILGLAGLAVMIGLMRGREMAGLRLFAAGYAALLASYIFTVLESFFLHDLFNLLEHISYALSGWLLALACWRFSKGTS